MAHREHEHAAFFSSIVPPFSALYSSIKLRKCCQFLQHQSLSSSLFVRAREREFAGNNRAGGNLTKLPSSLYLRLRADNLHARGPLGQISLDVTGA
jgi:hypothetical protein